jgi:transcriptional regulator with XRE-family HTH domain
MTQGELGIESEMKQARISTLERIGSGNFSIETLIRLASAFRVGLSIRFVQMSEMLAWENQFEPDNFDVAPIEEDQRFLNPELRKNEFQTPLAIVSAMSGAAVGSHVQSITLSYTSPASEITSSMVGSLANQLGGGNLNGLWPMAGSNVDTSNGAAA